MTGTESKPEMRNMTFAVVWTDDVLRSSMEWMNKRLGEFMEYRGAAWRLRSTSCTPEDEKAKTWMIHFEFDEVDVGELDRLQLKEGSLVQFARDNYLTRVDLGHKWARYRVGNL